MDIDLTATEENYLKAIYKANESSSSLASTNTIARYLSTSAASVTDMMKKLSQKNLVIYQKYHGVKLSQEGSRLATALVRKHRLWETFLVEKLGFSWEEVHDIAEQLEHVRSNELVDRLDQFLDYPKYDPHGDPIPSADGKFTLRERIALSNLSIGESSILVGVKHHDKVFLDYLNQNRINIGVTMNILSKSLYDHSIRVLIENETEILVTDETAKNLLVRKLSAD